jgi:hypothetical protein
VQAYKLMSLAVSNQQPPANGLQTPAEYFVIEYAKRMSPAEILRAKGFAEEWRKKHPKI